MASERTSLQRRSPRRRGPGALNKRARLWNSAELLVLVLVLVLSEAVLAIEKDGKSRDY